MDADEPALSSILEQAARGDGAAWRSIVERYSGRVYGLLRSQGANPELAEEIAQSVFCTVAAKLGEYVDDGRFESWLFRIAMNRLRDEARRRKRHARTAGDPEALEAMATSPRADAGQERAGPEELAALQEAMARLSPSDREIIDLRHIGGLSFKQMSEVLGEPLGTLLARHHRALAKLRTMLESGRPGPGAGPGKEDPRSRARA